MTQNIPCSSTLIQDRAEGSPGSNDTQESETTLKTSTVPAVRISVDRGPSAETGVVAAVVLAAEGRDNDEAQDASRTTAETSTLPITQEVAKSMHSPSILIIEDSMELAEIIEATLHRINIVTAHETHGNRALNRYNDMKPDVVLLDIGLPDMTGWQLLDYIKEKKGKSSMPAVIIITAYGDPANRLVGKLQNVHDYLIKPFTADEVEKVVMSALSSARR
jgi:CheY-like chemotaxis protein